MDNDSSERPCYKIVHNKMSYFEASHACKSSNGYIPGINNNYKDISITTSALILKQLWNENYFWLGCQNLTGNFVCDDGTVIGKYDNWSNDSDPTHGRCVVVSLTTGKWKMANCLGKYAFPCKFPSSTASTTPETTESEPPVLSPPKHNRTVHNRHHRNLNITVDLTNLHLKLPNYSGIFCWIFVILIITFGYGRDQRFMSNPSTYSNSGIYSPDPSEEARLLEAQEDFRQRAFSTFSNRNWIPTINNANVQSGRNHSRSVIIPIPQSSSQSVSTVSPQGSTNIEELLCLHGNYRNFPSLPRSEVSSILEQLSGNINGNNYIRREDRPWDRPPQYPIYYTSADEEIGVALSRNLPQLLPPPPYYSEAVSSSNSVLPLSSPIMTPILPNNNLHNNSYSSFSIPTTTVVPLSSSIPPHIITQQHNNLSTARTLGIPVLPPAFENEMAFANRIRQGQNRRNYYSHENERLFKKHV
uniref:C-type lectin domain-containing protein n=1 Tax=Panagrolaimus sp. ES5 TaxID=591445 RepID=A0AC34GXR3_9BILA